MKKYCKYKCDVCFFVTSNKSKYDRHILTNKHKKNENVIKSQELSLLLCCEKCNKKYKSRVGLWRHIKKCRKENNDIFVTEEMPINEKIVKNILDSDMFMELINRNEELQNMLAKQSELVNKLIEREPEC